MRIAKLSVFFVLLLVIFTFFIIRPVDHSSTTGLMTGELGVGIGRADHYFTHNFPISNETKLNTGINASFVFRTNETGCIGFVNTTFLQENPTGVTIASKTAVSLFASLNTDLSCFHNVTVGINYTAPQVSSVQESTIRLYRFNNFTNRWDELPDQSLNTNQNFVSALTYNFSIFGMFGDATPSDSGSGGSSGGGSGGGGGGGGSTAIFEVGPEVVTFNLLSEDEKTGYMQIKNIGSSDISLKVEVEGVDFIKVGEKNIKLKKGETRIVSLEANTNGKIKPGVYIGEVVVSGSGITRSINVIAEVKGKNALFDISLEILPEYKLVTAGERIASLVKLKNIGLRGKAVDVILHVQIVDLEKKVFFEAAEEMLAVETDLTKIKRMVVPEILPSGKYLLIGRIEYANTSAESYDLFDVKGIKVGGESAASEDKKKLVENVSNIVIVGATLVALVGLGLMFYTVSKFKKSWMKKLKQWGDQRKKNKLSINPRSVEQKKRLIGELEKLNKGYEEGVIKKEWYRKTRIELIKKIAEFKKK